MKAFAHPGPQRAKSLPQLSQPLRRFRRQMLARRLFVILMEVPIEEDAGFRHFDQCLVPLPLRLDDLHRIGAFGRVDAQAPQMPAQVMRYMKRIAMHQIVMVQPQELVRVER